MNEKPLFSIIIPVYNAKKTIKRTLLSVLNQTYRNYEVLVVNDGSTDSSAKILASFAHHPQVTVMNNPNASISAARNCGLEQARGEFVLFLEADDCLKDNFLMIFKNNLEAWPAESVDLMVGNFTDYRIGHISKAGLFSNEDIPYILGELEMSDNIVYLHNKCYRRQILNDLNLRFMEGVSMSGALLFNLRFFSSVSHFLIATGGADRDKNAADSLFIRKAPLRKVKVGKPSPMALCDSALYKNHGNVLDYSFKASVNAFWRWIVRS
ncbi:glycosyltransferase family A protein [Erwiniaceae bacterium L1_54_3]|nr:glycosyltransferase family A protein [Erwiniaceae bacterium L1_54_3]